MSGLFERVAGEFSRARSGVAVFKEQQRAKSLDPQIHPDALAKLVAIHISAYDPRNPER
jgi:hypothetical protein